VLQNNTWPHSEQWVPELEIQTIGKFKNVLKVNISSIKHIRSPVLGNMNLEQVGSGAME
jgi:hypothetical protein